MLQNRRSTSVKVVQCCHPPQPTPRSPFVSRNAHTVPATSTALTAGVSTISPFKNRNIVASTLILRTLMFDEFFITIVLSLVSYIRGATIGPPVIFWLKPFQIRWGQWEHSCAWNLWSRSFWGEWVIEMFLKLCWVAYLVKPIVHSLIQKRRLNRLEYLIKIL